MYDYLFLIFEDLPNFIISLIIIIILSLCTTYSHILSIATEHKCLFKKKNLKIIYDASYNKIAGYIMLLLILDLSHVVIGHFEFNGFHLLFIDIPANHGFYDIYITAFTMLFFKEVLLTLKNISKLGIDLNSIINLLERTSKKLDDQVGKI